MADYEQIGVGYNRKRAADPRIVGVLLDCLNLKPGTKIADVGAGTGNYALALVEAGYQVEAVEPSLVMKAQRPESPSLIWHTASAESIPLPDNSVDGIICILAAHHFTDPQKAFTEMDRVCPTGTILFFTFDPRAGDSTWIAEYFPTIWNKAFPIFPPLEQMQAQLVKITERSVTSFPFPLPHDLTDHFAGAGWNRPEIYLDETFRAGMSPFASEDQTVVTAAVHRLQQDLESGAWDERFGELRTKPSHDLGYRFICARMLNE